MNGTECSESRFPMSSQLTYDSEYAHHITLSVFKDTYVTFIMALNTNWPICGLTEERVIGSGTGRKIDRIDLVGHWVGMPLQYGAFLRDFQEKFDCFFFSYMLFSGANMCKLWLLCIQMPPGFLYLRVPQTTLTSSVLNSLYSLKASSFPSAVCLHEWHCVDPAPKPGTSAPSCPSNFSLPTNHLLRLLSDYQIQPLR